MVEGVLGAKGCGGSTVFGCFPTEARLDANFENNTMKRMLRQDWFLLVDF